MTWIQRIENVQFTIITGDGKVFKPLWKNGEKSKAYNVSNYNFIDVSGGFSDRKKPQAAKFPLVFWFQGEDNIEQVDAFEASADDPRPWTIKHPYYGTINGQPLSIKRNDVSYNVTEVTVDFWESVSADYPNPQKSVQDTIVSKTIDVSTANANSYSAKLVPTSSDQQTVQDAIVQVSSTFDKLFGEDNFSEYQNLISIATNKAGNLTNDPLGAIEASQQLVLVPSLYESPAYERVNALLNSYNKVKQSLEEKSTVSNKLYFESYAATCIAAMCQASANPIDGDYVTRLDIEEISQLIVSTYADYLAILDNAKVSISNVSNAYYPSPVAQVELYELVVETTGNLFSLAFNAKQQRVVETASETNLILLTHKYMGLASNENLEQFRELNNIRNNELFRIEKGREIKFLV